VLKRGLFLRLQYVSIELITTTVRVALIVLVIQFAATSTFSLRGQTLRVRRFVPKRGLFLRRQYAPIELITTTVRVALIVLVVQFAATSTFSLRGQTLRVRRFVLKRGLSLRGQYGPIELITTTILVTLVELVIQLAATSTLFLRAIPKEIMGV
jgi:hypothetical protein